MERRTFRRALLVLLVADLLLQITGWARAWEANPYTVKPIGDAQEYWEWSARIAEGDLVGETPFLSAPLYPYFLGAVRALGDGLLTTCALQLLLRLATAALLARVGARLLGGPGWGLAAAAAFLLLAEPAFYAARVLNGSLQLFLLVALAAVALALEERRSTGRLVGFGALAGLGLLSNPALLAAIPFLAAWTGVRTGRWRSTATWLAACAATVAPATVHNALATRDSPGGSEFILVSAQAGITFAHGNGPGATGTYRPLEGVSAARTNQNADAYRIAAEATGEEGWGTTSDYFLHRGLDWLADHPGEAFVLELRKAWWFLSAHRYGDLYNRTLEMRDEQFPAPLVLPGGGLPLPWLLPGMIAALFWLPRRCGRRAWPFVILALAPLFVVLVFWYSPRYRLPVAPFAALLAPWGLVQTARAWAPAAARATAVRVVTAALGVASILLTTGVNALTGFDAADRSRAQYEASTGMILVDVGRAVEAIPRLRRAHELGYENALTHAGIAEGLVERGRRADAAGDAAAAEDAYRAALPHYARALEINPARLEVRYSLASVLDYLARTARADRADFLRRALEQARAGLDAAREQGDAAMAARFRRILGSG